MKNNRAFAKPGLAVVFAASLFLGGCASQSLAPVYDRGGQPSSVPAAAKNTYTVKVGDTLYSIARDHNMDHRELIALNSIESPDRIAPGTVLKIKPPVDPSSSVASTAPVTTDTVESRPIGDQPGVEADSSLGADTAMLKREPRAGKEPYSDQALALAQNQGQPKLAVPVAPEDSAETKPEAKAADPALSGDEIAWIWPANGKMVGTFSEGGSKGVDIDGKAGDPVIASGDGKVVYSGTGLRGYGKLVIIKHNNTYLSAYAHNQNILVKEGQSVTKGQKIAEMGNSDADRVKLHFEVRRQGKPVDPLQYLPKR